MARVTQIDSEALGKELVKRGLTKGNVSESIGHGRNFISESMRKGRLSNSAVKSLEAVFNIDPQTYCVTEQESEPEPEQKTTPESEAKVYQLDYHELGKTIYRAVYQAVKKAWSE